jgi:hypothetical protein
MKTFILSFCVTALAVSLSIADTDTAVAWFTDATFTNVTKTDAPDAPATMVPGTVASGVLLSNPVAVDNPMLEQEHGYISFWLQPLWNGNDGKQHRILKIGDTENGLYLEKSPQGMLRYVMASPERTIASRTDVSNWKSGEWHHVVLAWYSYADTPVGLPLWVDTVAVDGPIASGCTFLDPSKMDDVRIQLGDPSAGAVLDELVMRKGFSNRGDKEQVAQVHRDYFRSAPVNSIEIDPEPLHVPADRRVVNGHTKQFGLNARLGDTWRPVTDFAVRYGQWANFDAKPFITWTVSDPAIASVDKNGLVTGKQLGKCVLTAEYRGCTDTYDIEVIPVEQPDPSIMYVESLPRYSAKWEKDRHAPGDIVTSVVHVANYGYKPLEAGVPVQFELIPETNNNCERDANEKPSFTKTLHLPALAPAERTTLSITWRWPEYPVWISATIDPDNTVSEICEANNAVCELSTARPLHFSLDPIALTNYYLTRSINYRGSFNMFDWINGQNLRMDVLLRNTKYPDICPNGITEMYRMDKIYERLGTNWFNEPWELDKEYYDGGFPVGEKVNIMAVDSAIIHEQGHTCLALPDLYGYPVRYKNVFLKDEDGNYYAGGPVFPRIAHDMLPLSSAVDVPCGVGYKPLMDSCHFWIHPCHAGKIESFKGYRGPHFWGVQGRQIPWRENYLKIYDINDKPLTGAAVYVYHVSHTTMNDFTTKYFADCPKYLGNTDKNGRFQIPGKTDKNWDSPYTDAVDGECEMWSPFGTPTDTYERQRDTSGTPSVYFVEGLLLVKIVSDGKTELHWLPMTEFNEEFFRGNLYCGSYDIRTSLTSSGTTPVKRKRVTRSSGKKNLKPVAVPDRTNITVACGEKITLDASKSYDPEGQPLVYWWKLKRSYNGGEFASGVTNMITAPAKPETKEYYLCVLDGIRASDPVTIKVTTVEK